jgi:SAM-dependent methyltransferase
VANANADQIRFWNEVAAPTWVAAQDRLDAQLEALGLVALDRAAARAGERVLDVGCGCGATSLELARQVGGKGAVLGIDVSGPMLARARERAADLPQLSFAQADAQTAAIPGAPFDLVFSRFGVMFFEDPTAAFANLRTATRPGGRLTFLCWQPLARNPWQLVPAQGAARHLTMSPPQPGAPGPFSFGDAERVRGILSRAGWSAIEIDGHEATMTYGGDLDGAARFVLEIGPVAAVLREQDADEALRARVFQSVRDALAPFEAPGGARLDCATWIVSALNPS